jgi:hypothetical protein
MVPKIAIKGGCKAIFTLFKIDYYIRWIYMDVCRYIHIHMQIHIYEIFYESLMLTIESL